MPNIRKYLGAASGWSPGIGKRAKVSKDLSEPLGRFIKTKLCTQGGSVREGGYEAPSGTIKDKLGFCEKAVGQMTKFEELSPEARELTVKMYEFVRKQNGAVP